MQRWLHCTKFVLNQTKMFWFKFKYILKQYFWLVIGITLDSRNVNFINTLIPLCKDKRIAVVHSELVRQKGGRFFFQILWLSHNIWTFQFKKWDFKRLWTDCFLLLFRFTRCQMLLDRVKRTPLTSADYFKARGRRKE